MQTKCTSSKKSSIINLELQRTTLFHHKKCAAQKPPHSILLADLKEKWSSSLLLLVRSISDPKGERMSQKIRQSRHVNSWLGHIYKTQATQHLILTVCADVWPNFILTGSPRSYQKKKTTEQNFAHRHIDRLQVIWFWLPSHWFFTFVTLFTFKLMK